jgi:hypothetical protein
MLTIDTSGAIIPKRGFGGTHMSDWEFLWGLKGKELEDSMSSGGDKSDHEFVATELKRQERKAEWDNLKQLRDTGIITKEEFKSRKRELFPVRIKK